LYRIVREIPPISCDASSKIGLMSVLRNNSNPAVKPAGPAPIITAYLAKLAILIVLLVSQSEVYRTCTVPSERKTLS